ncbi:MAG TPA: amidase family protein [Vicinamibacterales bacterium]|jgi:Asp-tRNA(Asn)/Glu-tRNA(Gln) amidotransferase A subunit family amidase|nr:amidase family protein [Vicinamibacterales bacterium]
MRARAFRTAAATLLLVVNGVMPPVTGLAAAPAAKGFQIEEATIDGIQSAILDGRLTSTQVVEMYLQRIKAYDGPCVSQPEGILGPFTTIPHAGQINSLITVNLRPAAREALGLGPRKARSLTDRADDNPALPDALEVAAKQDGQFKATRKLVGPLHGVTLAIKDWYDTADMRTTAGADAAYANDRPPRDATFVTRLRDAGAIILAKANVGSGISRSPFGGISCNPYDTERSAGTSSSGSGTSVAANLVTCAIAEETGGSILHPTKNNMVVGLAPTQELVSRNGMYGAGYNTRTGPICRTVKDAARILDVIAGYDPKDELTVFSVGRTPAEPYASFAGATRLDGVRIGVIREYMDRSLFNQADEESIAATERALLDLKKLGATIVDPGEKGALLQKYIDMYAPSAMNKLFIERFPTAFPIGETGKPTSDHIALLVDMAKAPERVPEGAQGLNLRNLGRGESIGESRYMIELYLKERNDAKIRTVKDLNAHSKALTDTNPDAGSNARGGSGGGENRTALTMDTSDRWLARYAVQQIVLAAMEDMKLDAMISPTGNIPPYILGRPLEPTLNGRGPSIWSFLGTQGFPELGVPAGWTTKVYDRVRDAAAVGGTRLTGPTPAKLPLSIMFFGRPFSEPMLFKIASAYEGATHHREPPPEFGPAH